MKNSILPRKIRLAASQFELWQMYRNWKHAKQLASTSKRLDLCAAQFAHLLHVSGHGSLKGKSCLEIGSGWVLSHALICHLLGAERVIASDISGIASLACLTDAIRGAVPSIVRDILTPFEEHHELRRRLDGLLSVDHWTLNRLKEFGIEYLAPIDLAKRRLGTPVDFIYSFSSLQYVPITDIEPLLRNLAHDLSPGGAMIHCIHLEDDRSIIDDPFAFLTEDGYSMENKEHGVNRVRRSQWNTIFSNLERMDFRFIYEWRRMDKPLPKNIAPSVVYQDENDLRTSHIGAYCVKQASGPAGI